MGTLEYYCQCLNLGVIINDGQICQANVNEISVTPKTDTFFQNVIRIFAPQGATIAKKLDCLCQSREVNEWKITFCLNCGTETHASNNDTDKQDLIFISADLKKSSASLPENESENYSPVFHILVPPPTIEKHSHFNQQPSLRLPRDVLENKLQQLKNWTSDYIIAENDAVVNRIRDFENEQMAQFNQLQWRAQRDQDLIERAVTSYYKQHFTVEATELGNENLKDKTSSLPLHSVDYQVKSDSSGNARKQNVTPTVFLRPNTGSQTDSIFTMDEENEEDANQISQPESDSDPEETPVNEQEDDEEDDGDDAFLPETHDTYKFFATSLPISMPGGWRPASTRSQNPPADGWDIPSGNDRETSEDPQWIAASIQALAMSVRGSDGTEMFGARPRPRLNTLD